MEKCWVGKCGSAEVTLTAMVETPKKRFVWLCSHHRKQFGGELTDYKEESSGNSIQGQAAEDIRG